jgi:hypothetical protein
MPFYFGAKSHANPATPGVASANGIVNGPLSSPNLANASLAEANGTVSSVPAGTLVPGNSTYQNNDETNTGTFVYPYSFDSKDNGELRWLDVEVTPVPAARAAIRSPLLTMFPLSRPAQCTSTVPGGTGSASSAGRGLTTISRVASGGFVALAQ